MGLKERHEREREAVSRAILDAARELFVAEGYPNVSLRKIAERIEYSPAAIYGYFGSKDDIFFALAEEGFHLLSGAGGDWTPGPDPVDDVRQVFWNVYRFSRTHPEYYALMFVDRSVPRISRDWDRFAFVHDMQRRVTAMVQRAIDAGAFPPGTPAEGAFMILFAAVNGAAALRLCDRLAAGSDGDALARDTLEAALAGLRAGIGHTFKPAPCLNDGHHQ
jgi:AcrR family transcriptional regulator